MEDRRGEGLSAFLVELESGGARAAISALGAEAIAWSVGGRDLLWDRSTPQWDRVAPVLFPCVGWSRDGRVRVDGVSYPMPVHGFAPASQFELVSRTRDRAVFELRDSAATRAHYPFAFRLEIAYALQPQALSIDIRVENTGAGSLPYACGWHPGFAWPFAGGAQGDYVLAFSDDERAEAPEIAAGGLFSARVRPVPLAGRRLALAPELFEREALCFLNARSRRVRFEGPVGAIEAQARGFRHWALWSRPGAAFLCVEAWTGHGDPEGFTGDFREKPSIDVLAPGEARDHGLTLRYVETAVSPAR